VPFSGYNPDAMKKHFHKRLQAGLGLVVLGLLLLAWGIPAAAAPLKQLTPFPTPTPGPDGRILYRVQEGDTLLRISLISGVPLEELRGLNNLTGDNIIVGQELLLGLGGPTQVTPTPGPSPTPTTALPSPSPIPGLGNLCILLYNDVNGNSMAEDGETIISAGAISVNNRSGSVSLTAETTAGEEPQCFNELPEGEYSISVAIPEGYNPTTRTSFSLVLKAGDNTFLDFGAQVNSVAEVVAPAVTESGRSPWIGVIGGLFLLAGIVLAIFAGRMLKR